MIVGGGPAGASTAFFLTRAGARVILVDRAHFPREKACSEYLSPEASRILAAMGVEREIENAGAAHLSGMAVRAPNGRIVRGDFSASHGYRGFRDRGLAIRRVVLDALLLNKAREAGAVVREGERVVSLQRDRVGCVSGINTVRPDGSTSTIRAAAVVGADGLNSTVARLAGVARRSRWPRRIALVAHYRGIREVADWGEMHVDRGGYLGIARVDGGMTNVALVVSRESARDIRGDARGFIERWIAARSHLAYRFEGAEMVGRINGAGPFARKARRLWVPGVALVGDSAEFFDPFTGEGMYTALRGGELLAPHLLAWCAAPHLSSSLQEYAAAARGEFGAKFRVEKIIGFTVSTPALMNRAAALLERRKDMADLLVGVTGDFVPAGEVLRPRYILDLLFS